MEKLIHIIWLGPRPIYDKYMDSVREFCPEGFKIKIWRDEEVWDLCSGCEYFLRNYNKGNWAFCSDYARFKILYSFGGIYIDTDVEFIRPIDDLIEKGSFYANEKSMGRVTSGLIVYLDHTEDEAIRMILDYFEREGNKWEYLADGEILAEALGKYGYVLGTNEQTLANGVTVYKGGTFDGNRENPEPWARAIHWYTHFWVDVRDKYPAGTFSDTKPHLD